DTDLSKEFGGHEWISDQKNPLSSFWPQGQTLVFPYEPEKVLAAFPPALLESEPALRPTLLDPHRLCRAAPDFPPASLAAGPYGAALDWLSLKRTEEEADSLLREGDVQGSSRLFDRSLAILPEQLSVLLVLGGAALGRQPAEALPWYRRCVET